MSVFILVNGAGSEKEESQLNILMTSLSEISIKHKLNLQKTTVKNIPTHLEPLLSCYSRDGKTMVLLLFDVVNTLGEPRLTIPSII